MELTEKLFAAPRNAVRMISLFNLVFSILAGMAHGVGTALVSAVFGMNVSISILFMVQDEYKDGRASVLNAILASSVSAAVSVLLGFGILSESVCVLLYLLAVTVLLGRCLVVRTFKMMDDEKYLLVKVSGWEIMLCLVKMCFLTFFMTVLLLSSAFLVMFDGVWARVLSVAVVGAFYAVMYVRNMTSSPLVSFTASGVPVGERDMSETPLHPFKAKEDFSYMYMKLQQLMDGKQPFLDPEYSLDTLAKDLFSNKTYVSRLINVCTGMNFSQLMNKYRIDYAKELFEANQDLKVRDITYMSGFNSPVSFNMAFKLFVKKTPGVWCSEIRDATSKRKSLSSQKARER